jgi:putative oxygen-independent coproporphyrinogen III oxidase
MALGLYISVPFCRTKCTYCNFASDVFSKTVFQRYIDRVCQDLNRAPTTAEQMGGRFEREVDTLYLGGGTPTVLDIAQLERLFVTISQNFDVQPNAEVTVECAPGTLAPAMIEALRRLGVNRVSLGVQSFVDREAASVGRLHTRATVLDDIARLRDSGISNINIDLIAGLPHQTADSWKLSLEETIATQAPHVSVYMLEVDEDSRLGRELIAGGTRYHAHFVPEDDLTADFYLMACERLEDAGVRQYEISNLARDEHQSRHNLKYWSRQPYLGFGVDAHSMLKSAVAKTRPSVEAVRFSTPDSLESYIAESALKLIVVNRQAALEETFFLGLRLNHGVDLDQVVAEFGDGALKNTFPTIDDLEGLKLLVRHGNRIRLTSQGRLLSNEVFERFLAHSPNPA